MSRRPLQLLFVADALDTFKPHKDSTFAMMRQAEQRGHRIFACHPADLHWRSGGQVSARVQEIRLVAHAHERSSADWFEVLGQGQRVLAEFDAVLMRKDPPFDSEFFYATHLLSQAEREGARVFNAPAALREHPEKLAIMEFPHLTSPTLVARDAAHIREFHRQHGDIILKPLDGMGGMGIFRVRQDGLNLGSIIETLNQGGATTVMAQKFVPAIAQGDKRILIIGGEPVPFCLARIPQGGEVRGNLAAGGLGEARALTERDWAIAREVGTKLAPRGLLLIGLDVIGENVTEINVTSPTCFQEIHAQTGCDVSKRFIDALEAALG